MKRRIGKLLAGLMAAVVCWNALLGVVVWRYGVENGATRSDCIIVLGAAVHGSKASPVFEERIRHGVQLYQNEFASKIIFTGGVGKAGGNAESAVAREMAIRLGVPEEDILIEEHSRTTRQNLAEARSLMRAHGLQSAILVSDPLHMKRAVIMAEDMDMAAVSSPTPTSRYRSLRTQIPFLLRELYFIHHYLVTGD
jgi:uncharacterized SAM-binding protein YcdF (DUF218 family)